MASNANANLQSLSPGYKYSAFTAAKIHIYTLYVTMYFTHMTDHTISSTELARNLGDVLGRLRYRGDSFIVERNGTAVARLVPLPEGRLATLRDAAAAWGTAGTPEPGFADDLEQIGSTDRPAEDAWAS